MPERERRLRYLSEVERYNVHLEETKRLGVSHGRGLLDRRMTERVKTACGEMQWKLAGEPHENVAERYYEPLEQTRRLRRNAAHVRRYITDMIQRCGVDWKPNTTLIQMYDGNSLITSHQDSRIHNEKLVVVATLRGVASCQATEQRGKSIIQGWTAREGDIDFYRAEGLVPDFEGDPRVFHSVSGLLFQLPRIAIVLRHDPLLQEEEKKYSTFLSMHRHLPFRTLAI